ncbi:MAG: hypothetical protein HY526_11290 [Betaproteobacteria bacterium]|nr:hypothetical protein [Betaproteobacteria bacterium]
MKRAPYCNRQAGLGALPGGQTDLMFASLSSAIPLIKAGRLRAFAVTGARVDQALRSIPDRQRVLTEDVIFLSVAFRPEAVILLCPKSPPTPGKCA